MHCKHYTGEYKNNMQARAIDYIYLRPSPASKNVHEFYNTSTKKIVTRQFCASIPTPSNIINIIEQQAQEDNMPIGIAFKPIDTSYTHIWLAGVDSDKDHDIQIEEQTDQTLDNKMDVNEIHNILQDPSDFHRPNKSHTAYIPEIQNHK